ncbi:acylphosphatase [Nitrososphaera sp.]|uniref:acylphosphatase n=1 Tax=Nitrososphaera sp. TaxID=1971748 RepID=UPI0017FC5ED7|nr:acylphosphatase [Nitrososphaera sp.]NWG36730.1 acylphosphatase [Nitrososphaera sp.]
MADIRVHVFVTGKVQGVYFRQNTMRTAREYGATGWVRNLDDGRVEAVIEGTEEVVRKVVEWCHQGPSASKVDDVQVRYERYTGEFSDFTITG